ncbi:response regulator [Polaribacter filamentus]|uniref:response regulator n=1 Tax=Polaribacter filamentus TaxID=53483 RepID=UPI000CF2197A|nr:response regulator [Polaribacter filamentus]
MKYLIAEDEIDLQQAIVTYLQRDGNICEVASNFREASEKAAIYEYDIIILDINLVSGSGLDILKTLKKEKKKAGVIIISANNSLTDKLERLDLGADDYITKPFHLARHTFATTVTLTNGVPIESVSKMLGHKSLKTTQHYAKVLDRKVSEDMQALKNKFLEQKINNFNSENI